MKTIFSSALVAITALAAGLTSCQNENGGIDTPKGGKSVVLSFSQDELSNITRAVGDSEGTQDVVMTNARVFFTTASGGIMEHLSILGVASGEGDADYNPSTRTVGINKITGDEEVTVEGLPGSVTKVVIVGNHTAAMTTTKGSNISDLSIAVAAMANFDNIPLAGSANLTDTEEVNEETGAAIFEAEVDIYPVGARIEIGEIAADASGSTIESFTLAGIYANNFYPTMAIDGLNPGTIVNGQTTNDNYAGGSGVYTSANLYDNPASAEDDDAYTAGTDKVWGYNLLAPTTDDAEMAHIVIHLTDVVIATADGDTYAGDQYLTIRNFYLGGNKLEKLDPGYIYKIEKISFAESDLTGNPERFLIDAVVTATVKGWTAQTVTTDFE